MKNWMEFNECIYKYDIEIALNNNILIFTNNVTIRF